MDMFWEVLGTLLGDLWRDVERFLDFREGF